MHITPLHLAYWRERKSRPSWLSRLQRLTTKETRISIDMVVNCHDTLYRPAKSPEPQNTINILRLARRRTPAAALLVQLAGDPEVPARPGERRLAYAKRWARRINRAKAHQKQESPC